MRIRVAAGYVAAEVGGILCFAVLFPDRFDLQIDAVIPAWARAWKQKYGEKLRKRMAGAEGRSRRKP